MISEQATLAEVVRHGIDAALAGLFKAGPGIVKAYDPLTNTAFVQPCVKHAVYSASDGERTYEEIGEIPFVPVIFPRAGGYVMRMPVNEGDTVLLVYCDSSLAEWRETGGVVEPQDARRHSLGWPVAIPGFFPDMKPMSPLDGVANAAIFGEDGGKQMRVSPSGIELSQAGVSPISPIALATPTDAAIAAIVSKLNALITAYNSHVHSGVATGSGSSGTTASTTSSASSPASTASTLVKSL